MASLAELQALKTDVDDSLSDATDTLANARTQLAAFDLRPKSQRTASYYLNRRMLEAHVGHLSHVRTLLDTRSRFLTAEVARVQGGGSTSTVPMPQTTAELSPRKSVNPIGRGFGRLAP